MYINNIITLQQSINRNKIIIQNTILQRKTLEETLFHAKHNELINLKIECIFNSR